MTCSTHRYLTFFCFIFVLLFSRQQVDSFASPTFVYNNLASHR